jgi:mono/diheme cytochrome c family protein
VQLPIALTIVAAGWATGDPARIARGKAVYETACMACHGRDGRGNPDWESAVRPVEMTDCATTAEPTAQWESVVRNGGAAHGLSSVMPAFGEAFEAEEIRAVVAYLRTFCPEADRYPAGDLNFRRLLKTGKAFPEAEWVIRSSHRPARPTRETELEIAYENRLGPRFQYEVEVPLRLATQVAGEGRGVGDIVLSGKQVLHFDVPRRRILSGGLEVTVPTGSERKGLGEGALFFEPFLAYGQARGRTLVQGRLGFEAEAEGGGERVGTYAVGVSRLLGPPWRAWAPAVELVGAWDFQARRHDYGVWLETSKPLNKLGHVVASLGVQLPIRPREARYRLEAYLLWDFGDGPFWIGW